MAKYLHRGTRSIVTVDTPKTYKEGYRHVFTADPNVVDLHRLGPYFYLFGEKLLSLQLPDTDPVARILLKVIVKMYTLQPLYRHSAGSSVM